MNSSNIRSSDKEENHSAFEERKGNYVISHLEQRIDLSTASALSALPLLF
jgi:hypothetical protein